MSVDPGTRLTHKLRLADSGEGSGSPTRRGKPLGVAGAEVWVKLVDTGQPAPTDPAPLSFLALISRPTVRIEFKAGDGGERAVYVLQWVNTRGRRGLGLKSRRLGWRPEPRPSSVISRSPPPGRTPSRRRRS